MEPFRLCCPNDMDMLSKSLFESSVDEVFEMKVVPELIRIVFAIAAPLYSSSSESVFYSLLSLGSSNLRPPESCGGLLALPGVFASL